MMLKSILQNLESEDRRRLMHAFDNEFAQHVEYAPGRFIGVNIQNTSHLKIDTRIGVWSEGEIT